VYPRAEASAPPVAVVIRALVVDSVAMVPDVRRAQATLRPPRRRPASGAGHGRRCARPVPNA
jgi:hypothetical protein